MKKLSYLFALVVIGVVCLTGLVFAQQYGGAYTYESNLSYFPSLTADSATITSLSGTTATFTNLAATNATTTLLTVINAASTTKTLLGNGTASAPSLSFKLDPDTGVFRAGANSLGFSTNGAQGAVLSSNLFGVGTTTPTGRVAIASGVAGNLPLLILDTPTSYAGRALDIKMASSSQIVVTNNSNVGYLGVGTTTPKSVLSVSTTGQQASTYKLLTVASTTGRTLFQVLSSGNTSIVGNLAVSQTSSSATDGTNFGSFITNQTTDPAASAEVTNLDSEYNLKGNSNGTYTINGIQGVVRSQYADESVTARGVYGRFYIDPAYSATLRTGVGGEFSARASYSGGTEIAAENGTAFVGSRIWMAPYFSAATLANVNNFHGLWIYGEHSTQINATNGINISDAGGGWTNGINLQGATINNADIILSSGDTIKNLTASSTYISGKLGFGTTTPKSILSVSTLTQAAATTKLFTVASTTGKVLFQVLGDGTIIGQRGGIVDHSTTDYQVLNTDLGSATVHTMTPAGATTKTFTLPTSANIASYLGKEITFVKNGAGTLVIQAGTGQYIADSTSGGTIYDDQASETWATMTLIPIDTTHWVVKGAMGTWTTN